jgi:hypothetical protein
MTQLIQRPDYIEYSKIGLEEGWYTIEDRVKLENETALFEWEEPYAFMFKTSAWKAHLKALSIFCVPYLFCFLYSIYNSINHNRSPWEDNGIFVFFGLLIIFAYSFFYYISRSQYYHIVYKITESGVLRDQVKRYPKFRYRRQDPTKLMNVLQVLSIPLIILAIAINPILLVGAAGAIFLSFIPMRVDEPELADYIPTFWEQPNSVKENQINAVNINDKRRIIQVRSCNGSYGASIFCTSENFQQIKDFILNKLLTADREFRPKYH